MTRHSTASWIRSVSSVQGHSMNQVAIRQRSPPPPPSHSASSKTHSEAQSTLTADTRYSRQTQREASDYHKGNFAHLPKAGHFEEQEPHVGPYVAKTTLPSEFKPQQSNNSHISTSSKNSAAIDRWKSKQERMRRKQKSVRHDYERQSEAGSAHPSSAISRASGITDRTITQDDSVSQAPSKPPSRAASDPPPSSSRRDRRNRYAPRRR
jgi:hypothetical protein